MRIGRRPITLAGCLIAGIRPRVRLILIGLLRRILIIGLLRLFRCELAAAVGTEYCAGLTFCTAVGAIGAAGTGGYAAGRTDWCDRIHFSAAMSTLYMEHSFERFLNK